MPHAFSVEIHDYLSRKMLLAEDDRRKAVQESDESLQSHYEGQLLELNTLRQYLTDNFDLKTQKYY
jgi:hypothetical protein